MAPLRIVGPGRQIGSFRTEGKSCIAQMISAFLAQRRLRSTQRIRALPEGSDQNNFTSLY
jgi:hypothetical protein